ncbi:MAG TPA: aspartate-semialdehyde dehydrogenase [Tenuifilaceae bacterium]|nr:aspartate-semialdehyde dehydrogenase [Tenuifilaceae bacterium]HOZ13403.1 aspartate-semialdehyde dehydrogenase [Tenuifilaceae bacterium]HPI46205.1 aspartate-semialdehyde dehydrogenase [Tenuifilaceae bacterium]HPN22334.1 aspartate-semialdehyde dehydrogenase [Tenuifilaceae bacterium]HPV55994.1 aspartate-semialdehyde dehydrogenase [Tenuifilaceae bacterium]
MKVALVGATGLVGKVMLRVLEERNFPVTELIPAASEKSVGKTIKFKGKDVAIVSVAEAVKRKPAVAIFSAGSSASKEWAPKFAEVGTTVVDNSSCWRMYPEIPLVVPEVNANVLTPRNKIIANPNCSTIQLVVALNPLHLKYKIKRIVVSTYQSVTGTGVKAVNQLYAERQGVQADMAYPHPIDLNCFPHGGTFLENGYTTEEQKLVDETRKIIGDQNIMVSATVVRIPVVGGHSESVNVEFENEYDLAEAVELLRNSAGITVQDNPAENHYPMPRYSEGKDDVFVGRIRRDISQPKSINFWVVSDNLRKGAATNAIQIAEFLNSKGWLQ